jgi:hypothetical protein
MIWPPSFIFEKNSILGEKVFLSTRRLLLLHFMDKGIKNSFLFNYLENHSYNSIKILFLYLDKK